MNFEELIKNYDVKLVALKNKRRFTSKAQGYAYMLKDGLIMIPRNWRKFQDHIEGWGILNQYIPDLGYYLCCLDIDTKHFPLTRLLSEYPSSLVETNHGFHVYYLSTDPIRVKQLNGKEKELCPVDLRGQRDPTQCKEGNYTKMYERASGNLNIVDFNEVVRYAYSLFGIEAKPIGEYTGNVQTAELIRQNNNTKNNTEKFIAYYLLFNKKNWESAYDVAFPWGIRLSGWLNKTSMQRVGFYLMRISGYKAPRKWVTSFLSGYCTGEKRKPYFGDKSLKHEFRRIFQERFDKLNEEEIESLAKYCKDVRLFEILDIIGGYE